MAFTDEHRTPTAITQTDPIVVTIVAHGLENGQRLRATNFVTMPFANATGMEQLDNRLFVVEQATEDTFELYDVLGNTVDGTNYTAFINNGLAQFTLTGPDLFVENEID